MMRDPASLNKPSTREIGAANMIGSIPGTDVHWGLVFGVIAAIASYILIYHTVFGFAARVAGGNIRAAKIVGLGVGKLILTICFLAGAAAGLAEWSKSPRFRAEPMPTSRPVTASRHPCCVSGAAKSAGGYSCRHPAWWNQRQRRPAAAPARPAGRLGSGAAGNHFRLLASDALYGRIGFLKGNPDMADGTIGLWTVPLAVFGGAIRVSTPFLFVSLGECITERSGRINLGLEGPW